MRRPGNTCQKDVLRLLKSDVMEAKVFCGDTEYTKSYIVKTILLHMMQVHTEPDDWLKGGANSCLLLRYKQALHILRECIDKTFLEHPFIPGENILGQETMSLLHFINGKLGLHVPLEPTQVS